MKSSLFIFIAAGTLLASGCNSNPALSQKTSALQSVPVRNSLNSSHDDSAENRAEALARFAAGLSYEFNDQSDLALEQFYRAAQADPRNEQLALELSQRLSRKQQFDKAIERLNKVVSFDPHNLEAVSWLADAYAAKDDKKNAIKWYEQSKHLVNNPEFSREIDERIKEVQNH